MNHDRLGTRPRSGAEDLANACAEIEWRDQFETEPPPYNRRFLESRLAYPGEHAAIIERSLWDVPDIIGESPRKRAMHS